MTPLSHQYAFCRSRSTDCSGSHGPHPLEVNTGSPQGCVLNPLIRKIHKSLYFLRKLRRAGLWSSFLTSYSCPLPLLFGVARHLHCCRKERCKRAIKQLRAVWGAAYPPPLTSTPPDAKKGPPASWETPPTHCTHTVYPSPLRQEAEKH